MDENENDWNDFIDGALFAINTNVSSTTKFSSFIMFGRQTRLPFDVKKKLYSRPKGGCFARVHRQNKWLGPYPVEEINLENGTCQLRGRVEKILRRKTNLKDVKITSHSN